jgi:Ca2+-binding EF-hand superfamily protein
MPTYTVESLKNTHGFPKDQLKEFKTQFDAFDEDGGGSIETSELKNVLEKCGMTVTDDQVNDMIKEFDEDNSGSLDFQEFVAMMFKLSSGPSEKEVRKVMFEVRVWGGALAGGGGGVE